MTGLSTYAVFESGMGWVGLLAGSRGLRATTLPHPTAAAALAALGSAARDAREDPQGLSDLSARMARYLGGSREEFPDAVDFGQATPFQRRVWDATRLIPYGETRSYRWVARQAESPGAARAVGQALGRNPLPVVIPCHRVIAGDGGLGGFGGGLAMKRQLLGMESAGTR
jgi:methylated-DNA-[protein]-cysteine S-methyltransferase